MVGVSLVKAEAIVACRNANGPFKSLDDLVKVKGIGGKTLEANRSEIVTRPAQRIDAQDGDADSGTGRPFASH